MFNACSIYASTDAEVFGEVPGFTPADWLDSLLHGVCPMGESRNG